MSKTVVIEPEILLGYRNVKDTATGVHLRWMEMQSLLIQASSGQGKTWLIRRMVEQLYGKVQIFLGDPEGEYATLREKFDFVLIGPEGEKPADVRSAEMTVRKLMELRASAIFDMSELRKHNKDLDDMQQSRENYVRILCETLMELPKELRHPVILILDEVHLVCPQGDDSVSRASVIDICARGRKRGIVPVFATQRMAKVDKDAISELQNYMIGGTMLDSDVKRAIEHLGIEGAHKAEFAKEIRLLAPGTFWTLGRAISREPLLFTVGPVVTSHPKPGEHVPPASIPKNVQKLLPDLETIPQSDDLRTKSRDELIFELQKALADNELLRSEAQDVSVDVDAPQPTEQDLGPLLEGFNADMSAQVRVMILPWLEYFRTLHGEHQRLVTEYSKLPKLRMPVLTLPEPQKTVVEPKRKRRPKAS